MDRTAEEKTLDDIIEANSNSSRNVVFCPYCLKYYYNNHKNFYEENNLMKCCYCEKEIYVPPKIELDDNWQIWLPIFKNTTLFHTTDRKNVDSIKKYGGLYSWKYLYDNNIDIAKPGSNTLSRNLDTKKGLENYVRLSFSKDTPMNHIAKREGRIQNPVYYKINPLVILFKGTKFSNINATDNNASIGDDIWDFFKIDIQVATSGKFTNEHEKKLLQAEVLVKTHIPISLMEDDNNISQDIEDDDLPF